MRLLQDVLLCLCLAMIWPDAGPTEQFFSYTAEAAISQDEPSQWPGQWHVALPPVSEIVSQKIESRRPAPSQQSFSRTRIPQPVGKLTEAWPRHFLRDAGKPALFLLYHHFLFYDPVVS